MMFHYMPAGASLGTPSEPMTLGARSAVAWGQITYVTCEVTKKALHCSEILQQNSTCVEKRFFVMIDMLRNPASW